MKASEVEPGMWARLRPPAGRYERAERPFELVVDVGHSEKFEGLLRIQLRRGEVVYWNPESEVDAMTETPGYWR